jgi:hypothetical protein
MAWPAAGALSLAGFTYGWIRSNRVEPDLVRARIAWLALQWGNDRRFNPQPYEHLAKVLREEGRDREADAIDRARRDLARQLGKEGFWADLATLIMGWVGHGYDRGRAIGWTFGWWALGIAWIWLAVLSGGAQFSRAHPPARYSSAEAVVLSWPGRGKVESSPPRALAIDRADTREEESFDLVAPWWAEPEDQGARQHAGGHPGKTFQWEARLVPTPAQRGVLGAAPYGCPGVVVPVYALELMLPVADLGQASDCRLESQGGWGGVLQVWRAAYQVIGAFIIAVLGVAMTGLIRKG